MAPIHNRMPLMLEPADWPVWLGEEEGDPTALLRPADNTCSEHGRSARTVNSVRHNGPDLLRPMREEASSAVRTLPKTARSNRKGFSRASAVSITSGAFSSGMPNRLQD